MAGCFSCFSCFDRVDTRTCTPCKKKYVRLVNSIYPRPPQESLVTANMTKLTYYTITHPENLNKIGEYLLLRLSSDLNYQRYSKVKVAVEAMNGLLQACHTSPSLSLFLEDYLRMVQKLLETNNPELEKMATDLFVRFSRIKEQSPSYHREYDFFISKFSAMCHAQRGQKIKEQRYNGLKGIRGIIWKSASEDIQANIWEKQHMSKIIPSILYNFQEEAENMDDHLDYSNFDYPDEIIRDEPHLLALECLRELCGKCNSGFLRYVLDPVLKHCDLHGKWIPPAVFATHTFKVILCNIQTQDSFFVLQELINHLEQTKNSEVKNRIGITTVLCNIVNIAGATIGPLLLSVFNSLLKQLKISVEYGRTAECMDPLSECTLQDTLIDVMGTFASTLPDYQKVEIMMFTVSYISTTQSSETLKVGDAYLQKVLLKTLLQIATKYKTFYFSSVFTDPFLKTICQLSTSNDPELRLIAQQIFQTLFDRHDNISKLEHFLYVKDVEDLSLTIEKCMRQDQLFMDKNSGIILSSLYTFASMAEEGSDLDKHADSLLCSLCLICIETGHDTQLIEIFRLCFALQDLALDSNHEMSTKKRAKIHNVVAKYLNLCSQLLDIPTLCQHVQQTIENRRERGHSLLNIMANPHPIKDPLIANNSSSPSRSPAKAPIAQMDSEDDWTTRSLGVESDPSLLFNLETVAEILKASNKSVGALFKPFTSTLPKPTLSARDHLNAPKRAHLSQRRSIPMDHKDSVDKPTDRSQAGDDEDDRSLSVSSFDWSISSDMGRADAISWNEQTFKHELEVTLEELQLFSNSEPDPVEESRLDQEKSSEVLSRFRGKTADEFMQIFRSPHRRETEATPLLHRLLGEHQQWLDSHEKARPNQIKSIDDLEFPSYFIC